MPFRCAPFGSMSPPRHRTVVERHFRSHWREGRARPLAMNPESADAQLAHRCILCSRHHPFGDLLHLFAGICELTFQKIGLNLHYFLKIIRMSQLSCVGDGCFHILFGQRQSAFFEASIGGDGIDATDLLAASKNISKDFSAWSMAFSAALRSSVDTCSFDSVMALPPGSSCFDIL